MKNTKTNLFGGVGSNPTSVTTINGEVYVGNIGVLLCSQISMSQFCVYATKARIYIYDRQVRNIYVRNIEAHGGT